jgi:hypothetical protein
MPYIAGIATVLVTVAAVAIGRTPPAPPGEPFAARWDYAFSELTAVSIARADIVPRAVKTDRIIPDPPKSQEKFDDVVLVAPPPAPVVFRPKPKPVKNVCAKHGMRKVTTGSTWRCRK